LRGQRAGVAGVTSRSQNVVDKALKQHNDFVALELSKSHRAFDVSAKRFGLSDVAGRQSDAEKSATNAHVTSPLREIGDQRSKRRDIGVAGLHGLYDFFQGRDQILHSLFRGSDLLGWRTASLRRGGRVQSGNDCRRETGFSSHGLPHH
jgi:hypothetical protein